MTTPSQLPILDLDFFLSEWVTDLYGKVENHLFPRYEPSIGQVLLRTPEHSLTDVLNFIMEGIQLFCGDNQEVSISCNSEKDTVRIVLDCTPIDNEALTAEISSEFLNDWYEAIHELLLPLQAGINVTLSPKRPPSFTLILPRIKPQRDFAEDLALSTK